MDDFEEDLELYTEDDEASRVVKRRRVYPRKTTRSRVGGGR